MANIAPVYCRDCFSPMQPKLNRSWQRVEAWTCSCGREWRRVNENYWKGKIRRRKKCLP